MPTPSLPSRSPGREVDIAQIMGGTRIGEKVDEFAKRITASPTPSFLLRHNPKNWFVSTTLPTPTLLPEITQQVLSPGVNGVRTRSKNERDPIDAYKTSVRDSQDKGWIYIEPSNLVGGDHLPPKVPVGHYIRAIPCRTLRGDVPGVRHVECWYVPLATLPETDQRFKFHRASYERWLLHLVETGQVPACLDYIADQLIQNADDRALRANQELAVGKASQRRVDTQEKLAADAHTAADETVNPPQDEAPEMKPKDKPPKGPK